MDNRGSGAQKPLFSGESGRACEEFLRDIRAYAFSQGKQRDNAWMADFASTCLDGAASRWFTELDPDIQGDWVQLGKALVQQYPSDKGSQSVIVPSPASAVSPPGSATWTTPAAAPPPRPLPQPSIPLDEDLYDDCRGPAEPLGSFSSSPLRPRNDPPSIYPVLPTPATSFPCSPPHLLGPTAASVHYEPRESKGSEELFTRPVRDALESVPTAGLQQLYPPQAVTVQAPSTAPRAGYIKILLDEYGPSPKPGAFKMLNGPEGHTYIGITWDSANFLALGPGSVNCADVTAVSGSSGSKLTTASALGGESRSEIWTVDPNENIVASWGEHSNLGLFAHKDWLHVAGEYNVHSYKDRENIPMRWVFEPF